jgi:4,5-DOPA dioxygenase extradiol
MTTFPSLFLSHGSPMLALSDVPARDFLAGLGDELGRPEAILVASAHWETPAPLVSSVARNETIHDFYGFPPELYRLAYPAPGAPALAERAAARLKEAGLAAGLDRSRGLDHGAWVPLLLMYPAADIPVAQISIQTPRGPAHHIALGRALAPLREEGVLVIGSGSYTHNLGELRRGDPGEAEPSWVTRFADWFDRALVEQRTDDLVDYRGRAPEAARNHPTEEHLLPVFVALGAGDGGAARRLHSSATYGTLRMDAYAFGEGGGA